MINELYTHAYCKDDISKIENYDKAMADTAQTWALHHRLELTLDGEFAHTAEELKRLDMYYNRPYFELIFLTKSEHNRLHNKGKNHPLYGKHLSGEHRRKISDAVKGENNPFYGKSSPMKGRQHSEETRKKMSEAAKRRCAREVK